MMLPSQMRIFVATHPVDFRGSFDRLAGYVREDLGEDPRSGALYVFLNRRANRIKILFFDQSGDCLLYKRLDGGTFRSIIDLDIEQRRLEIDARDLKLLLAGIERAPRRRIH